MTGVGQTRSFGAVSQSLVCSKAHMCWATLGNEAFRNAASVV